METTLASGQSGISDAIMTWSHGLFQEGERLVL